MKVCRSCNLAKDSAMFSKNKRYSDGLWMYCKDCDCKRVAEYRAKYPERVRESCAKSRAKYPDRVAAAKRKYRENNVEKVKISRRMSYEKNKEKELSGARKWKLENKEYIKEKQKLWLKDNPDINRYRRSLRRASEKKAMPIWFDSGEVKLIYQEAEYRSKHTGVIYHVDHIVPLKSELVCGLHWHGNMQLLPASLNQSKSNRHWPDMP